jgi:hypothetical protein
MYRPPPKNKPNKRFCTRLSSFLPSPIASLINSSSVLSNGRSSRNKIQKNSNPATGFPSGQSAFRHKNSHPCGNKRYHNRGVKGRRSFQKPRDQRRWRTPAIPTRWGTSCFCFLLATSSFTSLGIHFLATKHHNEQTTLSCRFLSGMNFVWT